MKKHSGFTLIEVIIAITILSISLVLVMQLFAGGLRAARTSCDYTRAIIYARNVMEELSGAPSGGSGEFEDGFKWVSETEPYESPEETGPEMIKIKVTVSWPDALRRERSVELVSLRMVPVENEKL